VRAGRNRRETAERDFRESPPRLAATATSPAERPPACWWTGRWLPLAAESEQSRILKGNKAHGRSERSSAGNGGGSQRTRQWSKALESGRPPEKGAERVIWQRKTREVPKTSGAHARRDRPACRTDPTTSRGFHRPLQRTSVRRRRATPRSPVFGRSERAPRPPTGSPVDGVLGSAAKVTSVTDAARAGGETASAAASSTQGSNGSSPPSAHFGAPERRERLLRQPASAGIPPSSEEGTPERKASAPAQFGLRRRLFGGEGGGLERGGRRPTVGRQRPQ
jgi:hypothetical protein